MTHLRHNTSSRRRVGGGSQVRGRAGACGVPKLITSVVTCEFDDTT